MNSFVITDARVFDGNKIVEGASVLVEDGLIKQIGRIDEAETNGIQVISRPGHTLLPGLIDAHCHPYEHASLSEQSFRFGITTLLDMHNLHDNAVLQKKWSQERKDFPDVKSCHFAATIKNGWPAWVEMKLANNEVSQTFQW